MVLHHIADRSRLLIISAAALNTDIFCHRDLHMIDITPVPDRLKDAVSQAEDQDILHRLFAEIVVDAVDLFLAKDLAHLAIELFGRGEIVSKGFFDDDARPALAVSIQPRRSEILNDFGVLAGWSREVENTIAAGAALQIDSIEQGAQLFVAIGIVKVGLQVVDAGRKAFPYLRINRLLTREFVDGVQRLLAEFR